MVDDSLGIPEFVILGLLAEADRHAYQLDQIIEAREIRSWVRISFPSIYRVAKGLEQRGLVSSATELVPGRPARRLLSLTPDGRATLHAKVERVLADAEADRAQISLGLMFANEMPRPDLRLALQRMTTGLRQRIDELGGKRAVVAGRWRDPLVDGIFTCELAELEARASWAVAMIETLVDGPSVG